MRQSYESEGFCLFQIRCHEHRLQSGPTRTRWCWYQSAQEIMDHEWSFSRNEMPETDGGITRSVYSDPLVAAAPTDNINPVIPFLPWPTTFSQLQQAYAVSGLNRGHQYLGLFVPPTQLPPSTSSDEPLDLSIKGSQPSTCTNALDLTKEHMEGELRAA